MIEAEQTETKRNESQRNSDNAVTQKLLQNVQHLDYFFTFQY